MIRLLDFLQGGISFLLVFVAAILGWPVVVAYFGMVLPIPIGIAMLKEERPKGRAREIIELVVGFGVGVIITFVWLTTAEPRPTLETPTPWWMVFAALPSILFNLSIFVAAIFALLEWVFSNLKMGLEWVAGETVEDFIDSFGWGGGGGSSYSSLSYEGGGEGETSPPE